MSLFVTKWLEKLELAQYISNFLRNDISHEQLSHLSDADLIAIGIDSLGHRMRIMEAAKKLSTAAFTASSPSNHENLTERRQLTVMFCDLADSTGLASKLDPEDMRTVIRAFQKVAEEVIHRYDGHIAQYLGDGLLVYFGYPAAHEDDAIRAVHSALELPNVIGKLNSEISTRFEIEIAIRIGISTGDVIIGQIGTEESGEVLATGTTPNEAANYQKIAELNGNVISKKTLELLGNQFNFNKIQSPKYVSDQQSDIYTVIGVSSVESRFSATHSHDKFAMIGRNENLKALRDLWKKAISGESNSVFLRGEAGIGKSRMLQALTDSIERNTYHRMVYQCSPHHIDTPLYPAIHHLAFISSINTNDSAALKRQKLEPLIPPDIESPKTSLALLEELLGAATDQHGSGELKELSAKSKRQETMQLLLAVLSSMCEARPVLFIVEDVHWIDATTKEFIGLATQRLKGKRLLMVLTSREKMDFAAREQATQWELRLSKLSKESSERVVNQLTSNTVFPTELQNLIVSKTDGIPLFIEELTKTLLESDILKEEASIFTLQEDWNKLDIPSTLQDSLTARLDQFSSAKEVAQIASCIGRVFNVQDIANAMQLSGKSIENALAQLVSAELFLPAVEDIDNNYIFKHALVRDAAYASLPRKRKYRIHAALFNYFKEAEREPETLGFHAQEAGLLNESIFYWKIASTNAINSAAFSEAIAHLGKAIAATQQLGENSSTHTQELELVVQQSHASTALHGFAHPNTVGFNVKARALLHHVKKSPLRFPVLYGHWLINHAMGQHPTAHIDGTEMLAESEISNDRIQQMMAYRSLGSTRVMMGEFESALSDLFASLARYDKVEDARIAWQYNLDPSVPSRIYSALCYVCMGQGDQATEIVKDVETFANNLGHPHTLIYALSHLALTAQIGRWPDRKRYIDLTNEFVEKHDLMAYRGHALGIKAMMLYDQGDLEESTDTMQQSLSVIRNTKTHIYSSVLYANFAACLSDLQRHKEAVSAADTALSLAKSNSEYWTNAEVLRLVAYVEWAVNGDRDAQLQKLQESIELAKSQTASMWQLRSETTLAKIQHELGDSAQAKNLLQRSISAYPDAGKSMLDWQLANEFLTELENSK